MGVVTNEVCAVAYPNTITDGMICAGGVEGQDSCQVSLVVVRLVRTLFIFLLGRLWRSSDLQERQPACPYR